MTMTSHTEGGKRYEFRYSDESFMLFINFDLIKQADYDEEDYKRVLNTIRFALDALEDMKVLVARLWDETLPSQKKE